MSGSLDRWQDERSTLIDECLVDRRDGTQAGWMDGWIHGRIGMFSTGKGIDKSIDDRIYERLDG